MRRTAGTLIAFVLIALSLVLLCSCGAETQQCYYGYFEDSAFALVYTPKTNRFYCIMLPLEQILRWGKASGLDSIPVAMKNFVGLNDNGLLLGTSDSLQTIRDVLDALGSESDEAPSGDRQVRTLVENAALLSKKPLSDKMNQLCGQDGEKLSALLAKTQAEGVCYDAHALFDTDDLNFSQRYFTQWLNQVLGGN